jgi:hypothetical protein
MTPDRRLDQLEPEVAEVLQKTDRLIEGQGQIINEVSKIPGIEANTTKTAQAVAKLTVSTQRQYEELKAGQDAIMQYLREKLP